MADTTDSAWATMMKRVVGQLSSGEIVCFDTGRFDIWCVFIEHQDGKRHAPRDVEYFEDLSSMALRFGKNKVYEDFFVVYKRTHKTVEESTVELIRAISNTYAEMRELAERTFLILYAGMIAEENKLHTRLGKLVKCLGVHQVVVDGMLPAEAANWSRGMKWKSIQQVCDSRGLYR